LEDGLNSVSRSHWGVNTLALCIGLFLVVFLIVPVVTVVFVAFQDPNTGELTLINFVDFFNNPSLLLLCYKTC
jgi:iron(III) transport system permease protein